ncbi:prephenate dehydratase [Palleronia sp. LCG004]|uniref:prephenate dehydratase n=1 Tax=Palleronia sp. LCG004 TaxID=3079304 RepID=UPI0029424191|nr:prephenate dehydratase [Palleronia sp. LCG004]WOI56427.1 prephenate dehydratase [Palleronia sp. LCG004]
MARSIAFQGELGAYSHQACVETRPDLEPLACRSFEAAIAAVRSGRAELAMLPVENSTYGRVADIHRLLPDSGLKIVEEAFVRVEICLMAGAGTRIENIREVRAHPVLIPQCADFLATRGIRGVAAPDSAGAAAELARAPQPDQGVLASATAAETYGLEILARNVEDLDHNATRFLVMARDYDETRRGDHGMITSFVFRVRNIPAALYKAMGGFATNGVNMTKLESYMVGGNFTATQFYADVEGHPEDPALARALEELDYFTDEITLLGVYPADPGRR